MPKTPKDTCGFFIIDASKQKLLIVHSTNSRWSNWSIPKGVTKPGEDILTAAKREVWEETNFDLHKYNENLFIPLPHQKYKSGKKILYSFVFEYSGLIEIENDLFCRGVFKGKDGSIRPEVDAIKWVEMDKALNLIHEAQYKSIQKYFDYYET